jgi:hypothetical protein
MAGGWSLLAYSLYLDVEMARQSLLSDVLVRLEAAVA